MEIKTEKFKETVKAELECPSTRSFLQKIPPVLQMKREAGLASLADAAAAQVYGGVIRQETLARLPQLLEEFERNALANGARVFWAADAREANEYIRQLAQERGVRRVTKGKSMVTEETGLNDVLQRDGIEVWESDLGEYICQLLHRPPFHIVGPAINVPVEEVRDAFMRHAGLQQPTLDPVELGYAARLFLRDKFRHAQMGITGVNLAVAETGTIINVENEGNIRFSKASPPIQVSIMTLEKVVPTMEDALHLLRLLGRNCTGQRLTAYVSMDSGPQKRGEADGPEELFIIILDNGRTKIYRDPKAREALRCIRCAACLNICPVYGQIGGYSYGWAYSGPMGQVLDPLLLGLDRTQDLYRACTLCAACKGVCPVGLDHPSMFLYYRAKDVLGDPYWRGKNRPRAERRFFRLWRWAVKKRRRWNWGIRMIRPFLNRHARSGVIRRLSGPFEGWFRTRDLPAMAEKTFHERWKEIKKSG